MSLFGGAGAQPKFSFGLSTNSASNNPTATTATGTTSLFGRPLGASQSGAPTANPNQSTAQQSGFGQPSSTPQIDVAHIRNTTKFDHLQAQIQKEITDLDTAIVNQENDCAALATILQSVQNAGQQTAPAIDYVTIKHEELENGLGNDAEAIVSFRDGELRQDEAEVKCVFRTVDRLKVPRQYQVVGSTGEAGASVLGANTVNSSGLSGWWNQPQTLRGTRSASGFGGQSLQLVSEDVDDGSTTGPKTMIDLFDSRAESFRKVHEHQNRLLAEIEDFVEGLEEKVHLKEREVNERLNYGNANDAERREEERERQLHQLRFVFGEVQRGLFEMADKLSTTRDGVVDLGLLR